MDIILTEPHSNPTNCPNNSMLTLIADEYPTSKAMIASVLGAHLAGKKITGWIGNCYDSLGKLNAIAVEK